jgi:DNA recombination-dependent growth factor C
MKERALEYDISAVELLAWELAQADEKSITEWQADTQARSDYRAKARAALKSLQDNGIRVKVYSQSRAQNALHELTTIAPRPAYVLEEDHAR